MTDYLKAYEKFKHTKEVGDYINDVLLLRYYHDTQQFSQMRDHILKLTDKYFIETLLWNGVNTVQPTTIEQSYLNAKQFLKRQGAKIIAKTVSNYSQYLPEAEAMLVKSMLKAAEQ